MSNGKNNLEISVILKELEFISEIQEKYKPCFSDKSSIKSDAWFATIRRRMKGEKGEKGVIYINQILDSCDFYYRMCDDFKFLKTLRDHLKNAQMGVKRLIETYNDQKIVQKGYLESSKQIIHLILKIDEKIDEKIKEINRNNNKFFEFYPSCKINPNFFKFDKFS